MLLQGIFPAITTPFYAGGALYLKKLEHNVERYSRTPIAGMVVLGSTGEAVMLSDAEQHEVLRVAAATAAVDKVLVAGTGRESVSETLALTEYAATLGYDCALVRTPHFYRPQMHPKNILAFYRSVADRSPLPVLLYNVPVFTAYDLPAEIIIELAAHPNIIGLKESSGNIEKIQGIMAGTAEIKRTVPVTEIFEAVTGRMLAAAPVAAEGSLVNIANSGAVATMAAPPRKTRTRQVSFQVLTGQAQTLHQSLVAGAVGGVLAFAAAAPTACFEIFTAWKEEDAGLAAGKQTRIAAAAKSICGEWGISALKYAADLNGYYGGPARLPLLPPTGEMKTKIENLMRDIPN